MRVVHHQGGWVILMTFIAALILTLLPLPEWLMHFRPEWVTLVLIYWCMALPERVGVGIGWIAGLFLDVIHGAILGQYAMALALIAYFTLTLHQRLRVYPLGQQALIVLLLVLFQQLLLIWIKGIIGQSVTSFYNWLPAITTMLL